MGEKKEKNVSVVEETETKTEEVIAEVGKEDGETPETGAEAEGSDVEGEVVVSIGEDAPAPDESNAAPTWVKDLRKDNRAMKKKIKALESSKATAKTAELGEKPTLAGSDYDSSTYEKELESWHERKRDHDKKETEAKETEQKQAQSWQGTLDEYGAKKDSLKVSDFDEVEAIAADALSENQQGMILQGAENSAVVMYALGKNPKRLGELAEIKDPVKFAFAVAKLEVTMKVTKRKASTEPEQKVSGTGQVSGSGDSKLENLRKQAEKTGDFTEVRKYKKSLKTA